MGIVKVGGHGNYRLHDSLAQVRFRVRLELLQDHSGDFRRAVLLALHLYPGIAVGCLGHFIGNQAPVAIYLWILILATHKAFDGVDGIFRIGHSLALGDFSHQALTGFVDCHDGWSRASAFRVRNNDRFSAFHNGNTRVCCSQVNSNYFWHSCLLFVC